MLGIWIEIDINNCGGEAMYNHKSKTGQMDKK